jgi:single-stranded-DNA-specific exonuclease
MSSIHENWISINNYSIDGSLSKRLNYSPILLQLLANRNILTEEKINSFLHPALKDMYSPKLLPNISKAVNRLKKAIINKEKILIFGDYDTDGIVSTALIYNFLKKLESNVDFYIPDRFEDGYDINIKFIEEKSIENKYDLIICVDCGTNSSEVKKFIINGKSLIDIIVCDHHEPAENVQSENYIADSVEISKEKKGISKIKNRYIIVNPKLEHSQYPFKHLSGAAVVFKVIIALVKELDEQQKLKFPKDYLTSLIDLIAVSTIADLMPLVDENRIIVNIGLKILKQTRNKGLKILIGKTLRGKEKINTHDIGFIIAPRINASGRIKNAINSLNLLINETDDIGKIIEIVEELELFNNKRQRIQQSIVNEILKSFDIKKLLKVQRIFICKSSDWNEGVLGIVASDIVKRFNIPAILFRENIGELKGSGRSINCFNLYENLNVLRDSFIKFGGHEQACGITMKIEKFDYFQAEIIKLANQKITENDIARKYFYDIEINFNDINFTFLKELDYLEPYGMGNPKPLFLTRNCTVSGKINFSLNEKHAMLKLKNSSKIFNAVIFNYKNHDRAEEKLKEGDSINILYNIEKIKNSSKINNEKINLEGSKASNTISGFQLIIQAFC